MSSRVRNNKAENRFELDAGGMTAYAYYRLEPGEDRGGGADHPLPNSTPGGVMTFVHTEVPPEIAGHGIGTELVQGALEQVRAEGLKIASRCSFVSAFLGRHPEYLDLIR